MHWICAWGLFFVLAPNPVFPPLLRAGACAEGSGDGPEECGSPQVCRHHAGCDIQVWEYEGEDCFLGCDTRPFPAGAALECGGPICACSFGPVRPSLMCACPFHYHVRSTQQYATLTASSSKWTACCQVVFRCGKYFLAGASGCCCSVRNPSHIFASGTGCLTAHLLLLAPIPTYDCVGGFAVLSGCGCFEARLLEEEHIHGGQGTRH
jgi:hypothetical protein